MLADLRESVKGLSDLAGVSPRWDLTMRTRTGWERRPGYFVSAGFFRLLGISPILGRDFGPDDTQQAAPPVVIVSHRFWRNELAGRADAIGTVLDFGMPTTVIGVLPRNFRFQEDVDLWVPLEKNPLVSRGRPVRFLSVVARLAESAGQEVAQEELKALGERLAREYPDTNAGFSLYLKPLHEDVVGPVRSMMIILGGVVGLVLLIACSNVATLLLNQALTRSGEIAIRAAMGAGRRRILRQLLTEGLLLWSIGGVCGILVAYWSTDLLLALAPQDLPRLHEVTIDGRVLASAVVVTVLTGILAGIAPVFGAFRVDLRSSLTDGRAGVQGEGSRLRASFAVVEVAVAVVLVVGAGLMLQSLSRLMAVDPGFDREHVINFQMSLEIEDSTKRGQFLDQMFDRLEAIPGVVAAGAATRVPLSNGLTTRLEVQGRPIPTAEQPELEFRRASKGYFKAMAIPVLAGRTFAVTDDQNAPLVAVINAEAARVHWPGQEAIGQRVRFGGVSSADSPWYTIVGIVGDIRHFGLASDPKPEVYIHFSQGPPFGPVLAVRTAGDPRLVIPSLRTALKEVDPEIAVFDMETIEQRIEESVARPRFATLLTGLFGILALILAVVGVYGVVSNAVSLRRREIGIRVALGAGKSSITRLVLTYGLGIAGLGVLLGTAGAWLMRGWLETQLFGGLQGNLLGVLASVGLLVLSTLAACIVPAVRAMRLDPAEVLREG